MTRSHARSLALVGGKLILSIGLLWWLMTRPGMADFPRVVAGMDARWLIPAFLCGGISVVMAAWRWQLCLRAVGLSIPFRQTLRIAMAANAAGYFSFGSLGNDAARVLLVCRRHGKVGLQTTSSLAMDHASSLPVMVALLAAALVPLGLVPVIRREAVPTLVVTMVLVVAGGFFVRWKWRAIHEKILGFLSERATWRTLGHAALVSVPVWVSFAGVYYCVARGLGYAPPPFSFAGICAIADAVSSLPISVAGLGVREKAFQTLLEIRHQVPASLAVATSLAGFGIILIWGAIGALCLLAEPLGKDKTMA